MLTKNEYEDYRRRLLNFANQHFCDDVKYTKEDMFIFANQMCERLLKYYTVAREVENEKM